MAGEDALSKILSDMWDAFVGNPGLAFLIFLLLFLGVIALFALLKVLSPWTAAISLIIALIGAPLLLLELKKRGIISLILVLATFIDALSRLIH
jgi:Flp pilus assembly protein TadB